MSFEYRARFWLKIVFFGLPAVALMVGQWSSMCAPRFSALGINLSVSMIRRTSGSPPNQQTHYTYWITYVDSKKANYTAPSQWNGEGCCIM